MKAISHFSKRYDYSDISGGGHKISKEPPTWLKVATTYEKPQPPSTMKQQVQVKNRGEKWKSWWDIFAE